LTTAAASESPTPSKRSSLSLSLVIAIVIDYTFFFSKKNRKKIAKRSPTWWLSDVIECEISVIQLCSLWW